MNIHSVLLQTSPSIWSVQSGEELLLLLVALVLLAGMVIVCIVAIYLLIILRKALEPTTKAVTEPPAEPRPFWQRITGMRPMSREHELVMNHAYDDIYELDNPTPPWFMGLFYSTIGFGVVYLLVFHVLNIGDLQTAEYKQEVAVAEVQRAAYIQKVAGSINENTVALVRDTPSLEAGKALFSQNCVACHGQQGEGGVGPNLTDPYWLHGGSVKALFHTINEGVPEKGMMSWKKQFNPLQVQQVASYILSLQGTSPANAKAPQGEKADTRTVAAR
ncbi:cbb3-type cytochrome c oxidase N-terminal domain-containing protein [Spirosoma spitsbergense]|uniref:cbb3-type cytochrome c oxidase N-terminal domain-containing protein n=1 Tax=Spirosoma spitsbergense TaxID=431554 RepID=UPI000380AEDC|nr:cbb3-type cytochrome c oxidase N-terminal domain-containing protein [Spirosoma spitsbergense]